MPKRKPNKKYYFSVEGETEQWYLKWLEKLINSSTDAKYSVSFDVKIEKNPLKRVKALVVTGKTEIWHLSDYESDEPIHVQQFQDTMDRLKASKGLGKNITYYFGYSNLTFDLWIILHKSDCNTSLAHRKNYISYMNRAYNEHFDNMDEYKHEANFCRCLSKITLTDVQTAIYRAKSIMQRNAENGLRQIEYKGYRYYRENPSLEIWKPIENILKDCGLLDTL